MVHSAIRIAFAASLLALSSSPVLAQAPPFAVVDINVGNAPWQLNRAIEVRFSEPVDFTTVSSASIAVEEIGGAPAVGELSLKPGDPKTVVFQPRCPLASDYSDAGLRFGGVRYVVEVSAGASPQVASTGGSPLSNSLRKTFRTPTDAAPHVAFFDTKPGGGPKPVVRKLGADGTDATHVELGDDPTRRIYFERDPATGVVSLAGEVPLNLSSDLATQPALMIELDQAVDPSASNLSLANVHWQYRDLNGTWRDLAARIELARNCAGKGATVRLEPIGVLPPATDLRAVIEPAFRDIVGQPSGAVASDFAPAHTEAAPSPLADEYREEFLDDANEDEHATFAEPNALWGVERALRSTNGFPGSGGQPGHLDLVVPAGTTLIVDTTLQILAGYQIDKNASGAFISYLGPIAQFFVIDGFVDIDDLWVQQGATLRFQGPRAVTIAVGGRAQIDGRIDVSGTSSNGVATLNTTNIPEPGAPGNAGGGGGGIGNPNYQGSSYTGGPGFGAFNAAGLGGQGGETGWSLTADVNRRRGAGGGGGVFGANVSAPSGAQGTFDQRRIGLDAEKGFDNLLGHNGANHPGQPPQGGAAGASPFTDGNASNDFFGKSLDAFNGQVVLGELHHPWAGSGGGGGGNASRVISGTFPGPYNPQGDEKGAGGGGGGGSLRLIALGPVVFGPLGQLRARGGLGGGGENTIFLNRVGGGSGGGSGGHVIVESAQRIDLSAVPVTALAIDARGGQGGAGSGDLGGAVQTVNGQGETTPVQDACPPGYPTSGLNGCRGQVDGAGGDGGPGVVQLHTPRGVIGAGGILADILVPSGATLASLCAPPPRFDTGSAGGTHLVPSVGTKSRARSEWVPVGLGGFDPNAPGGFDPLTLDFAGVDPATGLVRTTNGVVDELPPYLGPLAVQAAPALPNIPVLCSHQVNFDATPLVGSPWAYLLENDELLDRSAVVLSEAGNPANRMRFDVADAIYDPLAGTVSVWTANPGPDLCSFNAPGGYVVELQPALFRITYNGNAHQLPAGNSVRIAFQATGADANGAPDSSQATALTSDAAVINAAAQATELRFLRFDVEFDLGANALGPPWNFIELDFLRLPYRW